jgi:putative ABC transport system permease protein
MVDLAFKMLLHERLRFAITVGGIAFAVMLVLLQVGLFGGLLANATCTIDHCAADLWVTSHNTPNVDFANPFPESRLQRVRSAPGVARADNVIVAYMAITLPSGAQDRLLAYALEDFTDWRLPWHLVEGSRLDFRRGRFFGLDVSAAVRFGAMSIGQRRDIMGKRLELVAVSAGARSFSTTPIAFMDFRLAQDLSPYNLRGNTSYILVQVESGAGLNAVRNELQRRLPFNDVLTRDEWAARTRAYWIKNTGLGFNLAATVFLCCLIGMAIVAQTLYAAMLEHVKEFGTVKAIGGSNFDIYGLLLKQAAIAAVAGFFVGVCPALVVRHFAGKGALEFIITVPLVIFVFAGTLVLCAVSAVLSFRRVASIDPALVFRS